MEFGKEYLVCWTGVSGRGEWERDRLCPRPGRHSVMLSFCADDWESGGRRYVQPSARWVVTVGALVDDEQRKGGCKMREREQEGM
jgi:hypothetical protein